LIVRDGEKAKANTMLYNMSINPLNPNVVLIAKGKYVQEYKTII